MVLTAHIFLKIFSLTTRLSKYLQTSGLDLLTAKRLISECGQELKGSINRDFDAIKIATDRFVEWAKEEIRKENDDFPGQRRLLFVQDEFPQKRNVANPLGTYRVEVFNVIMDTCMTSFDTRFSPEAQDMLQDLSLLDPRSFPAIEKGIPPNSLEKLTGALKSLNPEITQHALQEELQDLAKQWKFIKF